MAALMPIRMINKCFLLQTCQRQPLIAFNHLHGLKQVTRSCTTGSNQGQTGNSNKTRKSKQSNKKQNSAARQRIIESQGYGDIQKDGRMYRGWLVERLQQAERSLLLRLDHQVDLEEALLKVSKKHGAVKKHFHLQIPSDKYRFILLEMKKNMMQKPKRQIFLNSDTQSSNESAEKITDSIQWDKLRQCKNVSGEMLHLYEQLKLPEGSIRCHFFILSLVAQVVQQAHHNVLSQVKLMPFGSVASNLGMLGSSDLDLTLLCDNPEFFDRNASKKVLADVCAQLRRHPLFEKIIFLRHARVPIIKFTEKTTGLHIDLSWNKICGVLFSELLFLINQHEKNFYPLVFSLKHWAQCNKLWNGQSGISSFMLTMMLIGFLQQKGILPPLQSFYQGDEPLNLLEDSFQSWDKVEFIQTRHSAWTLFNEKVECGQLLREFFEFYSEFPYKELCIDLLSGSINTRETDNLIDTMCLWNPLEAGHNICRNVRSHHLRRFKNACAVSAQKLQEMEQSQIGSGLETVNSESLTRLEMLFAASEQNSGSNSNAHIVDIGELFYDDIDSVGDGVILDEDVVLKSDDDATYVEIGDTVFKS